ncbi:MAG TPA: alpha/beta fold hydrolase [Actinomycetota bacterium]|nr:alpha/beta fold hydrolase [Actinomycetota bacterium]
MGPPLIRWAGREESLRLRPKEWALLGRLALADTELSRADLARLLFPAADDPRRALRWHLNAVRTKLPAELGEGLRADGHAIGFEPSTDVAVFSAAAEQIRDRPGAAAHPGLLALYRGDLCEGLAVSASPAFDTWLYVEQEHLRRLFRQATVAYARWAIDGRRAGTAIPSLSRLVHVDPYCEDGHVLLVEAYESLGDREAARSAYRSYQRMVRDELQAEPQLVPAVAAKAAPREGRVLPRDELVALDEITMHIVEWPGEEPAVLAIHGTAGSAYSLTGLGERLAPEHRFIAMDLRGHGFSDKPPGRYDISRHIDDVVELMDALGLERPVVLGFCIGGPVAAGVALRRDVAGLVLMDAAIGLPAFLAQKGSDLSSAEASMDLRFLSVDEYVRAWRAENGRYSDEAERWVERFARFELAPLSDGTFRRRGLRDALGEEFESVLAANTLGMLAEVAAPALVVRAGRPWPGEGHWLTEQAFGAQLKACRSPRAVEARCSTHSSLVRDPEPDLIAALRGFAQEAWVGGLPAGKAAAKTAATSPSEGANGLANARGATVTMTADQGGMGMADPAVELEAFIRWLALDPEQTRKYLRDPESVLDGARLTDRVRATLRAAGPQAVLEAARAKAETIYEAPESWKPSTFNRDISAGGYGRKPADAE